jgi:hypothetical protein
MPASSLPIEGANMKGDYSRDTFEPAKHFTRVLMQQGRVQLDADVNEQTSILLHYLQTLARDLIGPAGGPKDFLGFEIGVQSQAPPNAKITDLTIGPGRYYVDGLLCENESLPQPSSRAVGPPGAILPGGAKPPVESGSLSYLDQPNYPRDLEHDLLEAPLLVYLDVWERHISAIEDPDILEIALGGPDTATRAKIVWQVKVLPTEKPGPNVKLAEVSCTGFEEREVWKNLLNAVQWENRGTLKARAYISEDSDEPCTVAPEAKYRRPENQLYRVEVHRTGEAGNTDTGATFKWSRENGSVAFPIQSVGSKSVVLEDMGRDDRFGLEIGDWVEVVDDDYTSLGKADPLLKVEEIDPTTNRISLSASPKGTVGQNVNKHPLLRRWDHQAGDPKTGGLTLANDAAALIVPSDNAWLRLEDGVQILFQVGAKYRTGDYWLIPARTESGDVEWPGPVDDPQAVAPHGVQHHYAPLAFVFPTDASPGRPFSVTDLRHRFAPAGQCCPTVTLDFPSTAAPTSVINFEVRVNPPDPNLKYAWEVNGQDDSRTTPKIEVNAAGQTKVTAKVTITGLPPFCPNVFEGTCTIQAA